MFEHVTTTYAVVPVPFRCPVCEGRGTVPPNFYTCMGLLSDLSRIQCKACEGEGIIWSYPESTLQTEKEANASRDTKVGL